jgi:hypothetical protein
MEADIVTLSSEPFSLAMILWSLTPSTKLAVPL